MYEIERSAQSMMDGTGKINISHVEPNQEMIAESGTMDKENLQGAANWVNSPASTVYRLKCSECDKSFQSKSDLNRHYREIHSETRRLEQCPECNKQFSRLSNLKVHIASVHRKNQHTCDTCGKKYLYKSTLNIHVKKAHAHLEKKTNKKLQKTTLKKWLVQEKKGEPIEMEDDMDSTSKCNQSSPDHQECNPHEMSSNDGVPLEHVPMQEESKICIELSYLKCEECGKSFSTMKKLDRHLRKVHELSRYHSVEGNDPQEEKTNIPPETSDLKCAECDKSFSKKKKLDRHLLKYHSTSSVQSAEIPDPKKNGSKSTTCSECGKSFSSTDSLVSHFQTIHGASKGIWECPDCNKQFSLLHSLKVHITSVHMKIRQTCKTCNKSFPHPSALTRHIRTTHLKERKHKCSICDKAFKQACTLKSHMSTHDYTSHFCPHCGKGFPRKYTLQRHIKGMHSDSGTDKDNRQQSVEENDPQDEKTNIPPETPDLKCTECDKSFSNMKKLERHLRKVHELAKYQSVEENDPQDEKTNIPPETPDLKERKHKCSICDKAFKQACHLNNHMISHDDKCTIHRCPHCGNGFPRKFSLQRHIKNMHSVSDTDKDSIISDSGVDTESKSYVCSHCGASYPTNDSLKRHINSNHMEVRHECKTCNKSFTQRGALQRHTKLVHVCSACGEFFENPRHLKFHQSVHEEEASHVCSHCGRGFSRKDSFQRHIDSMH